MALLLAHFISSRVHRRVHGTHLLAGSLPCTRILKKKRRQMRTSTWFLYTAKIRTLEPRPVKPSTRQAGSGLSANGQITKYVPSLLKKNNYVHIRSRSFVLVSLIWIHLSLFVTLSSVDIPSRQIKCKLIQINILLIIYYQII